MIYYCSAWLSFRSFYSVSIALQQGCRSWSPWRSQPSIGHISISDNPSTLLYNTHSITDYFTHLYIVDSHHNPTVLVHPPFQQTCSTQQAKSQLPSLLSSLPPSFLLNTFYSSTGRQGFLVGFSYVCFVSLGSSAQLSSSMMSLATIRSARLA